MFVDDISLFSVVKSTDASDADFNNDFNKISEWSLQWKMNFNKK